MKIMKEFKGLSGEELNSRLVELKKELLKLNVQVATGSSTTSPGKLKQTKKNIARLYGLLHHKQGGLSQ